MHLDEALRRVGNLGAGAGRSVHRRVAAERVQLLLVLLYLVRGDRHSRTGTNDTSAHARNVARRSLRSGGRCRRGGRVGRGANAVGHARRRRTYPTSDLGRTTKRCASDTRPVRVPNAGDGAADDLVPALTDERAKVLRSGVCGADAGSGRDCRGGLERVLQEGRVACQSAEKEKIPVSNRYWRRP